MNQEYKEHFIQAGRLAAQARSYGKALIVEGASYNEVTAKIQAKIISLGGTPAFPPQIALNEVAAHFLPQPGEDIIFTDQLIKLDLGVCFKGAIGDCAVTVDLSGRHQHLIDAAESALLEAEKTVKVGIPICEIGRVIHTTIAKFGLRPIKNLAGHGLGYFQVHTPPSIPNYDNRTKETIRPGMTFAIEPFATNGAGMIYEDGEPAIYSLIKSKPVSTKQAQKILNKMKRFEKLPFSIHDLLEPDDSILEVKKGLEELISQGIIAAYPPLIEEKGGFVAQAENSVLVDEKGQVFITTRI